MNLYIKKSTLAEIKDVQKRQNNLHAFPTTDMINNVGKGVFVYPNGAIVLNENYHSYFEHDGNYYLPASEQDINALDEARSAVILTDKEGVGLIITPYVVN